MADDVGRENGAYRWPRHGVPLVAVIISLVVAVGAVSVLIVVLFKTTTGPGQALRQYYRAVSAGDCDGAYRRLSEPLRSQYPQDPFCEALAEARGTGVPTDIEILEVSGFGEPPATSARVRIREIGPRSGDENLVWQMVRQGGDWFVAAIPTTERCEDMGPADDPCLPL
jgi:hypothetical protein